MRVAFVGASGYGNVGDDTYPILWRRYFPQVDSRVYNSDLPENGLEDDTDLVVFGGGGLLWYREGDAHFEYMTYYVEEARRLGIPYGFLSCDFQFIRNRSDDSSEEFVMDEVLEKWLPVLREAAFLVLRSRNSVELLAGHGVNSLYSPDLAYLYRPSNMIKAADTITVVPAGGVQAGNRQVEAEIESARTKWPSARLLFLNMGGPVGDEKTEEFHSKYPGSVCVLSDRSNPEKSLDIISRSHHVITGRYHGLVFARTCGVPCTSYPTGPYKIAFEPPEDGAGDPWLNVKTLARFLRALGE